MNIFGYDKLWGPSQRVVTLFVFVFGGLLGLPSCVIEQFVFWCSLKKNPTQKDYNFSGISSLALDPYFREIHQDKFRSLVTTLLQSSLLSWMRITVAGDLNGDKIMGKSILKNSGKKTDKKSLKGGWIFYIIMMLVMVPSYFIFIKCLSLLIVVAD